MNKIPFQFHFQLKERRERHVLFIPAVGGSGADPSNPPPPDALCGTRGAPGPPTAPTATAAAACSNFACGGNSNPSSSSLWSLDLFTSVHFQLQTETEDVTNSTEKSGPTPPAAGEPNLGPSSTAPPPPPPPPSISLSLSHLASAAVSRGAAAETAVDHSQERAPTYVFGVFLLGGIFNARPAPAT